MPARAAARILSFTPPTGSTLPRSVISPVMAMSRCTGILRDRGEQRRGHGDAGRRAVLRDRSLGDVNVDVERWRGSRDRGRTAPRASGRTTARRAPTPASRRRACRSASGCPCRARARLRSTGSRRRLPSRPGRWPGRSRPCRGSAASGTSPCRGARGPSARSMVILRSGPFFTTCRAILRSTEPTSRSRLRTPASRVYDSISSSIAAVVERRSSPLRGPAPASASAPGTAGRWPASRGACSRRAR